MRHGLLLKASLLQFRAFNATPIRPVPAFKGTLGRAVSSSCDSTKESGEKSGQVKALICAAIVVVIMVIAGYFLQSSLQTAEIAEPEPTDTVQDLPAGRGTGNEQPTGAIDN